MDIAAMIHAAVRARLAADSGIYCVCDEPKHTYTEDARPVRGEVGTMCEACLLEDRALVRRMTDYMNAPHPFEPDSSAAHPEIMCSVCSNGPNARRHWWVA